KMKDWPRTIKTLQQYVKTYGQDAKGSGRNLEAWFRMATAHEALRQKREAYDIYRKVVAMGSSVSPASDQAEYPAHAAFVLTEERLPQVEKTQIKGGGKALKASIDKFKNNVEMLVGEYNK